MTAGTAFPMRSRRKRSPYLRCMEATVPMGSEDRRYPWPGFFWGGRNKTKVKKKGKIRAVSSAQKDGYRYLKKRHFNDESCFRHLTRSVAIGIRPPRMPISTYVGIG